MLGGEDDSLGWVGSAIDERFAIEEVVGEGGFGIVYRARHLALDERVAVKCLRVPAKLEQAERIDFLRDFREEARTLHRLSRQSTAIVQALDVGGAVSPTGIWTPYIVMEWLEGRTLEEELSERARLGRARRSVREAVELLAPAAYGLAVAHASGIAHLDVKPPNLFLTELGGVPTMKVLDFGIARAFATNAALTRALTRQGTALQAFTPNYAAPEQFHVQHGEPGAHTDVFALALVLLEVASGEPALAGTTPLQLYMSAANPQLRPSFASHGLEVDERLEAVLRRALEVEPPMRFPDAGALWRALEQALAAMPSLGESSEVAPVLITMRSEIDPTTARLASAPTAAATTAVSGENRIASVVCAELCGTAGLVRQLDPEDVQLIAESIAAMMDQCVSEAGGMVYERMGDTLIAAFGLSGDSATAAERAIHASLGMQRGLRDVALPQRALQAARRLTIRVGIHTGRVFVAAATTRSASHLTLTGAPLALAPRLQQAAHAGAVLVASDTYRQVRGSFAFDPITVPVLEDDDGTTATAYRVVGLMPGGEALQAIAVRDFLGEPTRFVGRAGETERIVGIATIVTDTPEARAVIIEGLPGVGKSRLLLETAEQLKERGFMLFAGTASALYMRTSYALAAKLLRGRFEIREDDDQARVEAKVRAGIAALAGDRPHGAPARRKGLLRLRTIAADDLIEPLLSLLGHSPPLPSRPELRSEELSTPMKQRIAAALAALVASARAPVALVCDDVHWADDATLELFDELLVRLHDDPLLILCAGQPALFERRAEWLESTESRQRIELGAMPASQLEEMARDRLAKVVDLRHEVPRRLAAHAEGYPLTLVETLHYLADAGILDVARSERWTLAADRLGELVLPTTVQGIVQARLDRLDETTRTLLGMAAVVGRTFWDGAVAALSDTTSREAIDRALSALSERGLVRRRPGTTRPGEQEYAFVESATQQVAYDMLRHSIRRELHLRHAEWLVERSRSDADQMLLARHFEQAAALERAWTSYARAGAYAASLGQNVEARHAYERACRIDAWMPGTDVEGVTAHVASRPESVKLRVELGDVLQRSGEPDAAVERYEQARALIVAEPRAGDEPVESAEVARWLARIDFRLSTLEHVRGDLAQARRLAERAVANAGEGALVEERAQILSHLALLEARSGNHAAALDTARRGIRICRGASRAKAERWREVAAWLLRNLGVMFFWEGKFVRAERCYLQASRLLDERRHTHELARVLNNVGAARHGQGDLSKAGDAYRRALDLAERSGDMRTTMVALANLGEVEHLRGAHEVAREHLEEAVLLGEQLHAHGDVAEIYRNLGSVHAALDDLPRALATISHALRLARRSGARIYLAEVALGAATILRSVGSRTDCPGADTVATTLTAVLDELEADDPDTVARCRRLLDEAS